MPISQGGIQEVSSFLTAVGGSAFGGGSVVLMAKALLRRYLADLKELKDKQSIIDAELKLCIKKTDCENDQTVCSNNIGRTLDEIKDMIKTLDARVYDLVKEKNQP